MDLFELVGIRDGKRTEFEIKPYLQAGMTGRYNTAENAIYREEYEKEYGGKHREKIQRKISCR